jgi:hypothetical protein
VAAGRVAGPSGEYSTCLTDEQRRDATQMRDFTTGVKPFGALGRLLYRYSAKVQEHGSFAGESKDLAKSAVYSARQARRIDQVPVPQVAAKRNTPVAT